MANQNRIDSGNQNSRPSQCHVRKRLFTLKEAAEYLGRSEWGMRTLIWSREIPVVKISGGRKIFVDVNDLNAFIERSKVLA